MEHSELYDLSSELYDLAWNNCYKIDVLKGYCENLEPEKVSSTMIVTLLEEISENQNNLKNIIDKYCTLVDFTLFSDKNI